MAYRVYGRLYALVAAVALWMVLGVQFHIAATPYAAQGHWSIAALTAFLLSDVVLTDVLAALSLTVAIVGSPRAPWPNLMTAIALYLLIAFGLHHFHGGDAPGQGVQHILDIALTCAVPAGFALYWLLFVPKGHVGPFAPILWLIYPAALLAVATWRGVDMGIDSRALLDVAALGYRQVAVNAAGLLAVVLGLGLVSRALDRLLRPLAMK